MWNIREDLKGKTLDQVLDYQPCFPYAVAAINRDGDLNVGMMLRTAVIFGASEFFIFGDKKFDKRTAKGAHNYIKVVNCPDLTPLNTIIKQLGWTPVFMATSGKPLALHDMKRVLPHNPCFIFGNESKGLPRDLIPEDYEHIYCLRQPGVLRSLNVSSCAAIVMSRYVESMYN